MFSFDRYINGTRLDDRIIRTDWDAGFKEGRQFGRGKSGGQVRDEYRTDYDEGRGGYGKLVQSKIRRRDSWRASLCSAWHSSWATPKDNFQFFKWCKEIKMGALWYWCSGFMYSSILGVIKVKITAWNGSKLMERGFNYQKLHFYMKYLSKRLYYFC